MKLGEVMTGDPIAVGPETPLKDVAAILLEQRISGVPVIGERLEVLGVVSEADIVAKEAGPDPRERRLLGWLLGARRIDREKLAARTAAEAMGAPAITVGAEESVTEAARLMTSLQIIRELLLETLWLDEPGLQLTVERGEVRLQGKMRRRSDAELLARLTQRVPGVVRVHSTLRWDWDDGHPAKERRAHLPAGSARNRR